ncbi:substrate-binding domain-containing protein [Kribbella sp. NPDC026596]|uniref:substrate-binding domain-containing protein n=1 Tax=Kribbella sp. NPDC026596 TaxID=3155122 RepID=UPI0033DE3AE3
MFGRLRRVVAVWRQLRRTDHTLGQRRLRDRRELAEAVTGYGDHPYAAYLQTPLTTVRLPAAEVGTTAVDLLLQRLRTTADRPRKTLIRPELVVRASTLTPAKL